MMNLIDSPGTDDPDKKRTYQSILTSLFCALENDPDVNKNGIAAMLQCVMIPTSGRIEDTAILSMSKMLQSFTLSYPDSNQQGPKVLVLFTNFSRF